MAARCEEIGLLLGSGVGKLTRLPTRTVRLRSLLEGRRRPAAVAYAYCLSAPPTPPPPTAPTRPSANTAVRGAACRDKCLCESLARPKLSPILVGRRLEPRGRDLHRMSAQPRVAL